MDARQNTFRKITLLSGVIVFAVSVASPSLAKSPYYFVDDAGNTKPLYTNASCNGSEDSCVGFVDAYGTQFYSSRYNFESGNDTLKYKGQILIRQNSGNYEVVCKVKKRA